MYLVLYTDMDIEHQEQAYMKYLIDDLEEYAQSDYYPFHMPGHKRKSLSFPNPYEIDITEIDGFDNLHHATGMIKEAEVRGAELYHSKRCFFLIILLHTAHLLLLFQRQKPLLRFLPLFILPSLFWIATS